jgi:signal transduction histidine kinase
MQAILPDNKRVFQIAAWMWLGYVFSLAGIDRVISADSSFIPFLWYHLINALAALLLLGLSYSDWIKKQPRQATAGMILLVSAAPCLINYLPGLRLPFAPSGGVEGMILSELPVLLIGLALVAWHYNLWVTIVYSLLISFFEPALMFGLGLIVEKPLSPFVFIVFIRMVCFVVVGIFINQLLVLLRAQQAVLQQANQQLVHYASALESLAASRERSRISRELLEKVVHTLSGQKVQLETGKTYWNINPSMVYDQLDQALDAANSALQGTRQAIKSLRASPLEDLGLIKALEHLSGTAAQRGRLALELFLPGQDLCLSPDVEQYIYRIAQEAIENVVHHACARHLLVSLNVVEKNIELLVEDDGMGFDPRAQILAGHFGVSGIQERAQLAGEELTVNSEPGKGTKIRLVVRNCL